MRIPEFQGEMVEKEQDVSSVRSAIRNHTRVNDLIEEMSIEELEQASEVMGRYRGMPDFVLKKFIECDNDIKQLEIHHLNCCHFLWILSQKTTSILTQF